MDFLKRIKKENNNNLSYFAILLCEYNRNENLFKDDDIFCALHVINEIILECRSNELKNETNNKIFKKKIENLLSSKLSINDSIKKDLRFINEQIYKKNFDIVVSLCEQAKNKILEKKYFNNLVDNLYILLDDKIDDNSHEIRNVFVNIIVYLLYSEYSFKTIIKKLCNIFSDSSVLATNTGEQLLTSFPIEYLEDDGDVSSKCKKINSLSLKERTDFIKKLYNTSPKKYYFVTTINGISLDKKMVKIGNDIVLYNPTKTKLYKLSDNNDIFKSNDDENNFYKNNVNVSVTVKSICCDTANEIAVKKIENFMNILKIYSPNDNFTLNTKRILILNSKKEVIKFKANKFNNNMEKREFEREFYTSGYDNYLNDKETSNWIKNTRFLDSELNKKNESYNRILSSLKKYSEGIECSNDQEAILKYWSSLECLFDWNLKEDIYENKTSKMIEILSLHFVISYRYEKLHEIYRYIKEYSYCDSGEKVREKMQTIFIPDAILKRCNLITNKKIVNLHSLAKNCGSILTYISDDYFLKNKINYVNLCLNNNNYAYSSFKKEITRLHDEILIIYRLRNQIIHNAVCNLITCKFYVFILKRVLISFINSIIIELINNKSLTISQVIMSVYAKDRLMLSKLEGSTLYEITFND